MVILQGEMSHEEVTADLRKYITCYCLHLATSVDGNKEVFFICSDVM